MFYVNKKGNKVPLIVTDHAKHSFLHRWNKLHPERHIYFADINKEIEAVWNRCCRTKAKGRKDKLRLDRHGKDTIFFRGSEFTFIVQNGTIKTIEISLDGHRMLNKPHRHVIHAMNNH